VAASVSLASFGRWLAIWRMSRLALVVASAAAVFAARSAFATFPYPTPPAGTPPQNYAAYLRLPVTSPPVRPVDFTGSTEWKLTSDQTGEPAIDGSPAQ